MNLSYLLPIRRHVFDEGEVSELMTYLQEISATGCEILVIDGSAAPLYQAHHKAWSEICRHIRADGRYGYLNGKVNGIHTGLAASSHDMTIVADDDIRYRPEDIVEMARRLASCEVVRPQNYFGLGSPAAGTLPWWARIESARVLLNRGCLKTGDYPGTCGFRRSVFRRVGPYDGDVLFDNEEMIRHFAVAGASIDYARDFFILKKPPRLAKWWEQRPRQAYEDFVMRFKTGLFLALIPAGFLAASAGPLVAAIVASSLAATSIFLAARGRRGPARSVFPWSLALYAPVWVLERALSVYWALYWRARRGGYPFGGRILSKGTGRDWVAGGRVMAGNRL